MRLSAAVLWFVLALPSLSQQQVVTARIFVQDANGNPVRGSYVALVPPYRPWSRPLVETIAQEDSAIFRVPAGKYRIMAGGAGFGPTASETVNVTATGSNQFPVTVQLLTARRGTTKDVNGNPLSGVRVTFAPATIPQGLWRYSALAAQHFNDGASTVSDDSGNWSLNVPADTPAWLIAEKDAYKRVWKSVPQSASGPIDFQLSKGAELEVLSDRFDPEMTVTLHRIEQPAVDDIPREWEPLVSARRSTATTTEWKTLPPGTYEILTKYTDPRRFGGKAVKLGETQVAVGEHKQLSVIFPPAPLTPAKILPLFLSANREELFADAQALGRGKDGTPVTVSVATESTTGGTMIYLAAGGAQSPFVAFTADRFISAPEHASTDSIVPANGIVLERGDANLHVKAAEPEMLLPRAALTAFQDCGPVPSVAVPIGIAPDGTIRTPAPAHCKSEVFHLDPFEPVVSTTTIPAGDVKYLGDFILRASGGADVHVVRQPGNASVDGATVRVAAPRVQGRTVLIATATTGADGWAHLSGLPPRRELRAVAFKEEAGSSPARSMRVEPRQRATIDPLAIPRPAALTVKPVIDPEVKRQYPEAQIAEIQIERVEGENNERKSAAVEGRESVRFEELLPGRWHPLALVRIAGAVQPLDLEVVELAPGEEREITANVKPLVFSGVVTSHGSPVESQLDISGPRGESFSIIRSVPTDSEGRFRVILPAAANYDVEIRRMHSAAVVPLGSVAFADPAVPIQIAFPEGSADVRVHNGERGVANAVVTVILRRDAAEGIDTLETTGKTDAEGRVSFEALPAGTWDFFVSSASPARSAEKTAAIKAGERTPIDIEAADSAAFSGTVRDASGIPQPEALVRCVLPRAGGAPQTVTGQSDADGRFTLDLAPPAPPFARCAVVTADGFVQGVRLSSGTVSDVTVSARSGSLRISWPKHFAGSLWLADAEGGVVDLSRWFAQGASARSFELPALAAGRWKVIRVLTLADWVALGNGNDPAPLAAVTLDAGNRKSIDLGQ